MKTAARGIAWTGLAALLLALTWWAAPLDPGPRAGPSSAPHPWYPPLPAEYEVLERRLTSWESRCLSSLESGQPILEDGALFDELLGLALERLQLLERLNEEPGRSLRGIRPSCHPERLWLQLFSSSLQARIQHPELIPSESDRQAMGYITEVLDVRWALRVSPLARSNEEPDPAALTAGSSLPGCHPALAGPLETAIRIWGQPPAIPPWEGVKHLLRGFFTQARGHHLARPVLEIARRHLGPLRGLDLAEIGPGSGPCLSLFRDAAGPEARLFAVEVDPFALDILKFLNSHLRVEPVQGLPNSIQLPRGSIDWAVMIGVHMGAGLGEDYERFTLPWLKSIALALRPGGALIIEDGLGELLGQGAVEKTERAGFRLLELIPGPSYRRDPNSWAAAFRVDKEAGGPRPPLDGEDLEGVALEVRSPTPPWRSAHPRGARRASR